MTVKSPAAVPAPGEKGWRRELVPVLGLPPEGNQ